ncbi:hypothetical protein [Puniceibacterium sediminis]|uniref:hypothetical protein n=1 Tax=Puniceibacterium sediminis TaxID=1608407 RepID=UPI001FE8E444|nr:hypothetical protein [Puniceibacterium sediminis]
MVTSPATAPSPVPEAAVRTLPAPAVIRVPVSVISPDDAPSRIVDSVTLPPTDAIFAVIAVPAPSGSPNVTTSPIVYPLPAATSASRVTPSAPTRMSARRPLPVPPVAATS